MLYTTLGRLPEAELLYKRALAIREKTLGPDHLVTGLSLNQLEALYRKQRRYVEAVPLYKRALAIRQKQAQARKSESRPRPEKL
jgi:tetratricopeptide (TPR) repeat protein